MGLKFNLFSTPCPPCPPLWNLPCIAGRLGVIGDMAEGVAFAKAVCCDCVSHSLFVHHTMGE